MKFLLVPLLSVGLFGSMPAQLLIYDGFDDAPVGDPLPAPYTGSGSGGIGEISPGLDFPGLGTVANGMTPAGTFSISEAPLSSSVPVAGGNTTQTLYLSFLVNLQGISTWGENAVVGVSLNGTSNNDGFYAGIGGNTGDGTNNKDWSVIFGRPNQAPGSGRADISADLVAGTEVFFLLAKFEWDTGNSWQTVAGGGRAFLNVYDEDAGLPAGEPLTWQASVTADKGFPFTNPASAVDTLTIYRGNTSTDPIFDEIRVGESFADVVPVPEPATGALGGLTLAGLLWWKLARHRKRRAARASMA